MNKLIATVQGSLASLITRQSSKFGTIATSVFLGLLVVITCLWFNTVSVLAHRPHDDVYAVNLSTNYQQDQTVFTIVRGNLLKSTDGGKS